jgi:hypothetical protein
MPQQTALELVISQLKEHNHNLPTINLGTNRTGDYRIGLVKAIDFCEQAKEMEKEQHLKWNKFLETEKTLGISDVKTIERIQWYYNQYYNETFKTKKP